METELCELILSGRWAGLTMGPPSERVAFWGSVPAAVPKLDPTQKGLVQKQDMVRTLLIDLPRNATLHSNVRTTGWAWQLQGAGADGARLDSVGGSCLQLLPGFTLPLSQCSDAGPARPGTPESGKWDSI